MPPSRSRKFLSKAAPALSAAAFIVFFLGVQMLIGPVT